MAKNREQQQADNPAAEPQQQPAATAPVVTNEIGADATEAKTMRSEIDRLRAENEILKRRQLAAVGLSGQRGQRKLYRVKLPGSRTCNTSRCVSPRLSAPPHIRQLEPASFPDLDLFLNEAESDPARLGDAAWQRYCRSGHSIEHSDADGATHVRHIEAARDKKSFVITAQHNGPPVDFLDIPAHSPADAFGLFCRFNGITATAVTPSVELIGDAPEDGPAVPPALPVAVGA